jgi:hypothetical protein
MLNKCCALAVLPLKPLRIEGTFQVFSFISDRPLLVLICSNLMHTGKVCRKNLRHREFCFPDCFHPVPGGRESRGNMLWETALQLTAVISAELWSCFLIFLLRSFYILETALSFSSRNCIVDASILKISCLNQILWHIFNFNRVRFLSYNAINQVFIRFLYSKAIDTKTKFYFLSLNKNLSLFSEFFLILH